MFRAHKPVLAMVLALGGGLSAQAAAVLRIGVSDSDGPPIVELASDPQQGLVGGLYKELGTALAEELGTTPQFIVVSRKRVEQNIEANKVDIHCNANPLWYGNASRLGWTQELYPQVERLIALRSNHPLRHLDELAGKRIGTTRGYHYPAVEALWASGQATRVDEARIELLMKSLQKKLIDVAIHSELEFAYWARSYPFEARKLEMLPVVVSTMPTMCAVAPTSRYSVTELNQAIARLHKSGKLKTILKAYQWQAN